MTSVSQAEFAWPGGDTPGLLEFCFDPPPAVTEAIRQSLATAFPVAASSDTRYWSLAESAGPVGRYRLTAGGTEWFLRVSGRWGNPELEKSLICHAQSNGVPVNPLLTAGAKLHWGDELFRVDVRPFIHGRHFNGTDNDLSSLASSLARCHGALSNFPGYDQVLAKANERSNRLTSISDAIAMALDQGNFEIFAENAEWARHHAQWLSVMVDKFDPHLHEHPGAQCLHGEIHPGNVLFQEHSREAVLVDFEESTHFFAPPSWDLAYLVQRFCLRDNPSSATTERRLSQVEAGYGIPLPELASVMRQAAWFSMAVILDLRISSSIVTPASEYQKFIGFEQEAQAFEGVL